MYMIQFQTNGDTIWKNHGKARMILYIQFHKITLVEYG